MPQNYRIKKKAFLKFIQGAIQVICNKDLLFHSLNEFEENLCVFYFVKHTFYFSFCIDFIFVGCNYLYFIYIFKNVNTVRLFVDKLIYFLHFPFFCFCLYPS